jgi:hypothetical protein
MLLFEPGPAWSFEHARRHLLARWVRTTLAAYNPTTLWRGLRPVDPSHPGRLALLAAAWLLALHLTAGALVAGGTLALIWSGNAGAPYWETRTRAALDLARQIALPYSGEVRFPVSSNSYISDPAWSFVMLAALPALMLGALAALFRPRNARHATRAAVYALALAPFWLCAFTATFAVAVSLDRVRLGASGIVALSFLGAYAAALGWWWSRYEVEYFGRRARVIPIVLRTIAAFTISGGAIWVVGSVLY